MLLESKRKRAPRLLHYTQLPIRVTSVVRSEVLKAALCVLSFTVLALTFRSWIHFKLIFVYGTSESPILFSGLWMLRWFFSP